MTHSYILFYVSIILCIYIRLLMVTRLPRTSEGECLEEKEEVYPKAGSQWLVEMDIF
jgi:hypothetical protein